MQKNNNWFFIIIAIIIILILWLFSIIIWKITDSDLYFIDNKIVSYDDSVNKKNIENIILKYSDNTNTDWFWKDELFCSGWILYIEKNNSWSICLNWEFANWTDNIDDKWDNDDFKASFSTWIIDNLVTIDSRKNDNDDYARKNIIWIIPPLKEQTILYINDKLVEKVSFNINNIWNYIETEVLNNINNLTLNVSLNNNSWSIEVFQIDKNIYNQTKDIVIVSQKKWEIKTLSWYIINNWDINNIWDPYIFDIKNYDYAINITNNNSWEVLTYEVNWLSNNKKDVYLVWLDDYNWFNNRKILFQELIKNLFGYSLRNWEY